MVYLLRHIDGLKWLLTWYLLPVLEDISQGISGNRLKVISPGSLGSWESKTAATPTSTPLILNLFLRRASLAEDTRYPVCHIHCSPFFFQIN